tara:strand:+ start:37 stop:411 length:375 start_codon:yes stop_codon:yes gene_type:complete
MKVYTDKKINDLIAERKQSDYIKTSLRDKNNNTKYYSKRLPNMIKFGWAKKMDSLCEDEWLLIEQFRFYPEGVPTRKTHRKQVKSNAYNYAYTLSDRWPDYEFIARKINHKKTPKVAVFGRRKQ